MATDVARAAEAAHRDHWGRVLAATMRLARDLDVAEEATADAFVLALQSWPVRGVPESVEAWLLTVARRRAIDRLRRAAVLQRRLAAFVATAATTTEAADATVDAQVVTDDELRLVVLCCHPSLTVEAQVALTMRLACGASTAAVASAFMVRPTTMAARLTRAKKRLADGGRVVELPDDAAVDERLPAVRRVVHLAYTSGHTAGGGSALRDDDLARRAVRLARLLHELRPHDQESTGLLTLVLLSEARAPGRLGPDGAQVLLADADRSRWDKTLLVQGMRLAALAGSSDVGPFALQAAIAAEHCSPSGLTRWPRVVGLYEQLLRLEPSPTVALGRCVAIWQAHGAEAGLADLDGVIALGGLDGYPYAHAARARMLADLGMLPESRRAWVRAASCARTAAERDYFSGQAAVSARPRPG